MKFFRTNKKKRNKEIDTRARYSAAIATSGSNKQEKKKQGN